MKQTTKSKETNEDRLIGPGSYRIGAACDPALVKLARKYRVNIAEASRRGILDAIKTAKRVG